MSERARVLATLDGYAVEGGFDRTGEPATCYSPMIALGRLAGPGDASGLWADYESAIDVAATIGLDGVRLSVEWARVEPLRDQVDDAALARYRAVAAHARAAGLRVTVLLVDAVWPAWLGQEAWLLPWVEPRAIAHARRVIEALGDTVDGVVIFADPRAMVERGFLAGLAPPWRRRARADAQSAADQLSWIESTLRADDAVGPLVVRRTRTISLERPGAEVAAARAAGDVDEIYLRSLVRGAGPTAASTGLLARDGNGWRVSGAGDLRAVLG